MFSTPLKLNVFQSWDVYFRNVNNGAPPGQAYQSPPSLVASSPAASSAPAAQKVDLARIDAKEVIDEHLAVQALIRGYQVSVSDAINLSFGQCKVLMDFFV